MKNKLILPERISKDEYYLGIAKAVAKRCTCFRRTIGAIIVRDDQIISTGYVGAPRKTKDSFQHGFCLRTKEDIPRGQRYELCRSVHAEQNTIINAARAGVSLLGGTMYMWGSNYGEDKPIDLFPCFICRKMIINAGLKFIVCSQKDGKPKIYKVKDWAKEWQEKDILESAHQYGVAEE